VRQANAKNGVVKLHPSSWSLRSRLVATVIAVMVAFSVVVGVISVFQMRSYLSGRLDRDVIDAANRTSHAVSGPSRRGNVSFGPAQPEGTVIGLIQNNTLTAALVLTKAGQPGEVDQERGSAAPLLTVPVDKRIHTRDMGAGLGNYRLMAERTSDGSVVVTGLPTDAVDDTVFRLSAIIVLVALVGLLLAALIGAAIVRLTLRPLRRVAATARQVSEMPLDRGEVALAVRVPEADTDLRTEVGQVGAAINSMLTNVADALTARQQSETRVRQFVADASHELRTPLAAIRGYTELARRAGDELPEHVTHAMSRVESQAVRMTGLVEDLLLLASLDSGRPIEREPVDLTGVLIGAVSDAHAAGPEHTWHLELPDDPMVTVIGEEARLTQVVVNLLANARAHTPPGTTVTVGMARRDDRVALTVLDDGPGIPEQLQPEVFVRFARGDASRSRAAGSTGLGLSIVSAIVTAHDGEVSVQSRPGRTEFTVELPMVEDLAVVGPV
jgi:two-component system OmpR family sensor kinase